MIESILLQAALLSTHVTMGTVTTNPAFLIQREETTIAFGLASFEEYKATRITTPWSKFPMVWVTTLDHGAEWIESTDFYRDSLPAIFAYLGAEVLVVPHRRGTEDTLPLGSCPTFTSPGNGTDCSAFGTWTANDVVSDIEYARDTLLQSPLKPAIGGHWTGAMAATAAVNSDVDAYSLLVAWEGALHADDMETLDKNLAVCNSLVGLPPFLGASDLPALESSIVLAARDDPWGTSQLSTPFLQQYGLDAGASNLEALFALFTSNNFALPDRVANGLVFMVGDPWDGPETSDITQVFNIVESGPASTYASLRILKDYACALGGDPTHTENLDDFKGDVLFIGSDKGLRDELEATESLFTKANFVDTDYRGDFGVHDLLWSDLHTWVGVKIAFANFNAHYDD